MNIIPAQIGCQIDDIDTPALVLDLDAFDRNMQKMASFAQATGIGLRPHAKTHRCPVIAMKQLALGAMGQCCQKVGEAEVLVRGGVKNILVSNQIIDRQKLRRLAALAKEAEISLCFDAVEQVDRASEAAAEFGVELGGRVEIDLGMRRCGIASVPAAADLALYIASKPNLKFCGLQAYHGAAQHMSGYEAREKAIGTAAALVQSVIDAIKNKGLSCEVVGGAGTGTYHFEGGTGVWNELQVGSYIFMDAEYRNIIAKDGGPFRDFEHSLFVLSTVMSTAATGRVVVDAGLKSYTAEKGYPLVHGKEGVQVISVSDEHGCLELDANAETLNLGDKVFLIPGHCDPTVNLHDWYIGVRNGRVEALWPIMARGASS
ncbi:DSD1 family PLP-dependent enzyme [Pollutimonas bauzanensis]|uniref:DSD1 family PLP-dependent enzyme n=1 Tax=Pollutimonas bauzanensis TaxID=658167 RepID=UPI0033401D90